MSIADREPHPTTWLVMALPRVTYSVAQEYSKGTVNLLWAPYKRATSTAQP